MIRRSVEIKNHNLTYILRKFPLCNFQFEYGFHFVTFKLKKVVSRDWEQMNNIIR